VTTSPQNHQPSRSAEHHYTEAEVRIREARAAPRVEATFLLAEAQFHATLALAAVTAAPRSFDPDKRVARDAADGSRTATERREVQKAVPGPEGPYKR
jgi:hypothetical protein